MPQLFVKSGDTLTKLAEEDLTEAEGLQTWLADNPELLAGEEMEPDDPRRFLLVRREAPVAGLALDHLFVDQEAVPTFVETKKASNRETRRQVVAQMLDYASEAAITWSGDMLKGWFEQRCESSGLDAEQELAQFKPDLEDHGEFWQRAKENLRDGKVRLIFASDEIPSSLQRIIEFLNERMDPTSVLGLEVRRHHAAGAEIFSSRLVGATERARAIKGGPRKPPAIPALIKNGKLKDGDEIWLLRSKLPAPIRPPADDDPRLRLTLKLDGSTATLVYQPSGQGAQELTPSMAPSAVRKVFEPSYEGPKYQAVIDAFALEPGGPNLGQIAIESGASSDEQ
jgi:hypothetical protein